MLLPIALRVAVHAPDYTGMIMMAITGTTRSMVAAMLLGTSMLASASPAEAGGLRGLFPGLLIGGLALGAFAAAAEAAQTAPAYARVPTHPAPLDETFEFEEPEVLPPARRGRSVVRRPNSGAVAIPANLVRACRASLAAASRQYGNARVSAVSAGRAAKGRAGTITIPLDTRIEYARQGRPEIRRARVACRVDASGRVIALR